MYQVFIELLPGFKLNLFISWYEVSRGHFYNIYTSIIRQGLSFSSMVIYCPITVILKLMINYIINIQVVLGGRDIYKTKCGSETDQFIFILSHNGLKNSKFTPSCFYHIRFQNESNNLLNDQAIIWLGRR